MGANLLCNAKKSELLLLEFDAAHHRNEGMSYCASDMACDWDSLYLRFWRRYVRKIFDTIPSALAATCKQIFDLGLRIHCKK